MRGGCSRTSMCTCYCGIANTRPGSVSGSSPRILATYTPSPSVPEPEPCVGGELYFVLGETVRSCGFPRTPQLKKAYKWKKLSTLHRAPKDAPVISYMTASARLGPAAYKMRLISVYSERLNGTQPEEETANSRAKSSGREQLDRFMPHPAGNRP